MGCPLIMKSLSWSHRGMSPFVPITGQYGIFSFLVNDRQLAYLVDKEYIKCPSITAEEIWDKSKADTLAKIITLMQASWLVIQLLGRAFLRLPTTTLELSAGAIVLCAFGTFFCWLHTPADVYKGIVITTEATTEQILVDAGENAVEPYR